MDWGRVAAKLEGLLRSCRCVDSLMSLPSKFLFTPGLHRGTLFISICGNYVPERAQLRRGILSRDIARGPCFNDTVITVIRPRCAVSIRYFVLLDQRMVIYLRPLLRSKGGKSVGKADLMSTANCTG